MILGEKDAVFTAEMHNKIPNGILFAGFHSLIDFEIIF